MINLDKIKDIELLDKDGIAKSIEKLPDQILQVVEDFKTLEISEDLGTAKNIVVCGMGGSALGGRIVDALIVGRVRVPIEVFTEVQLPNYVNKDTLVILSSYSGNTEETMLVAHDAIDKGAKIFGITTGGQLEEFLKKEEQPFYKFSYKHNFSRQPRMALGYSTFSILMLLRKLEFITFSETEIVDAVDRLKGYVWEYSPDVKKEQNMAKMFAEKFRMKMPILVASEHLIGTAHAMKNQLNENSKSFSVLFDIPELNHHLMEGLKSPATLRQFMFFLFFESRLYSPPVQKRYPVTYEVIKKHEIDWGVYKLSGDTKLEECLQLLAFGEWLSFYLALLYGTDPGPIPWVDYFKKRLAA